MTPPDGIVAHLLERGPWGFPRVAGRCPSCGSASLFLAAGAHVTCSVIGCADPSAADAYLHDGPPDAEGSHRAAADLQALSEGLDVWLKAAAALSRLVVDARGPLDRARRLLGQAPPPPGHHRAAAPDVEEGRRRAEDFVTADAGLQALSRAWIADRPPTPDEGLEVWIRATVALARLGVAAGVPIDHVRHLLEQDRLTRTARRRGTPAPVGGVGADARGRAGESGS